MLVPLSTKYCLYVLAPLTVRAPDDAPASSRLTQPRHLALLSYLLLARPRGLHARDSLIAMFWPGHDDERARKALRNALYSIRTALGADAVVSVGDGLVGVNPSAIDCDALALERGEWVGDSAPIDPFRGFHVDAAARFEHWVSQESMRLRNLHASAAAHAGPRATTNALRSQSNAVPPSSSLHRLDAYTHYVRGHYLLRRSAHGGSIDDLQQSRKCFEEALTVDPSYAPAVAGLSNYYAVAARREVLTPFHETFAKTIELSRQALVLDPMLAVPYVHFGVQALYLTDEFDVAGQAFETAIANEPSYSEGHRFYGVWLGLAGKPDAAVTCMEAAVRLEPDIPITLGSLAAARAMVGDAAGAEDALRKTLAVDARHALTRERLLRLLEQQARFVEAIAERLRKPVIGDAQAFADAFAREGDAGYARLRTEELRQQTHALEARLIERAPATVTDLFAPPVLRLVSCLAQLGEVRKARTWKLQACAQRPALARWFDALPESKVLGVT